MEEQHNEKLKDQSSPKIAICEECKNHPSKYKCPGCSVRSCSLPCVKAHKHRTGCSGNRNKTQFVPLSDFNDNLLVSDYNLLEEIKRVAESAQRMREKSYAYPQNRLPKHLQALRNAAGKRSTNLLLLPSGMSKRQMNQTRYNQRWKYISWTIEWRFHTTDVVLHDHGVHENTKLCSVIEKHLKPGPWNNKLKEFCDENLESLKLFIRRSPKGPKSPFCELDIKAPLRQQLANVAILEYPVIHVFLPSHSQNFEVVKVERPISHRPETKNPVNDNAIPEGVAFREEEIEDNNDSSDQHINGHEHNETLHPLQETTHCETSGKTLDSSTDGCYLARLEPKDNLGNNSKSTETNIFEDMEFDFDESFMDVYSDLIGEVNPDDFFDLEGELSKEVGVGGKDFCNSGGMTLVQEELEEGEIWE
ncbi:HIT-type Zinc finger family protein [Euphorbia peplus]|nr:HIT-type Zinc finger family protein [Euphorbia peplus]